LDIAPKCVAPNTYDYFSNSEVSYILTFAGLTIFIGGNVDLNKYYILYIISHFDIKKVNKGVINTVYYGEIKKVKFVCYIHLENKYVNIYLL
jgi:hypothetical protein